MQRKFWTGLAGAGLWLLLAHCASAANTVVITEILPFNVNGIADEDGANSPWIELYNATNASIDLNGYYLTDDLLNLPKWQFPDTPLAAGAYVVPGSPTPTVVFVDGKNRTVSGANLHTSFSLNQNGGYIGLVMPDGKTIVSGYAYPATIHDVSYGLLPDLVTQGFFQPPTPGAANTGTAYTGIAAKPEVLPKTGVYYGSKNVGALNIKPLPTVTVTAPATPAGAVVRYTTNGTDPTANSSVYTAPLVPTGTTLYKFKTFYSSGSGMVPSDTVTRTYFIEDPTDPLMASYTANVPVVLICSAGQAFSETSSTMCSYLEYEPGPSGIVNIATDEPVNAGYASMNYRGTTAVQWPKKPFAFKTQDDLGVNQNIVLMDMPSEHDWVMDNPMDDKSFMRDALAFDAANKMGHYASRTRFAEVFISNAPPTSPPLEPAPMSFYKGNSVGDYQGAYVFKEHIRINKNRVNITKLTGIDNAPPNVTGGYIVRRDKTQTDFNTPDSTGAGGGGQAVGWGYEEPSDTTPITASQAAYIKQYVLNLETVLEGPQFRDPVAGYTSLADLASFVDYHITIEATRQLDGYRFSDYFYKDRNGKLFSGPIWDWNVSFGNGDYSYTQLQTPTPWQWPAPLSTPQPLNGKIDGVNYGTQGWCWETIMEVASNYTGGTPIITPQPGDYFWYPFMVKDPDFCQMWLDHYTAFRQTMYSEQALYAMIDTWGQVLRGNDANAGASYPITAVSCTGNIATFTVSSTANPPVPAVGEQMLIAGLIGTNASALNGISTVTAATPATNTFSVASNSPAFANTPTSGGTAVAGVSYASRNNLRWNVLGVSEYPNINYQNSQNVPPTYGPRTYQDELNYVKWWIDQRFTWIDAQMANYAPLAALIAPASGPVTAGTQVTLALQTGQTGTIYYTADGSDPRQWGANAGQLGATAAAYTKAITVSGPTVVNARIQNAGGVWGPLVSGSYYSKIPRLVVTEIDYNPQAPPANSPYTASDFEFIELKNTDTVPINLAGVQLSGGITFTFPLSAGTLAPGAFVVLVKNSAAFATRYPQVTVFGQYTGSLSNSGETLTLTGSAGEPLLSFAYSNTWYPITDGLGFSLVIVDDTAALNTWGLASSWRPSGELNGSPGADDPPPAFTGQVLVNEVLSHVDAGQHTAFELYNPGSMAADISGWYITNDPNADPTKFQLPTGTAVPATGYLVLDDTLWSGTQGADPFFLNPLGDSCWLYSANAAGALTGYRDGFKYEAAQDGVSFGRYVLSTGGIDYPRQRAVTLDSQNAGPAVGPVIIWDLMYQPKANSYPYVVIANTASTPINLFDPNNPSNTWTLNGIGYSFPPGTVIAANSTIVLTNTDAATFAAAYTVPASAVVMGPYDGTLSETGEELELQWPEAPAVDPHTGATVVPYVTMDMVNFSNAAPWPAEPAAGGTSIVRTSPLAYGDDPINWQLAAAPLPLVPVIPTVQFSVAAYTVANTAGLATIAVVLNTVTGTASLPTLTIQYATSGGTAKSGTDYAPASGTLTFPPGTTAQSFTVSVYPDSLDTPPLTVNLMLALGPGVTNVGLGANATAVLSITNTNPPVAAQTSDVSCTKGDGSVQVPVTLSGVSGWNVSVAYTTMAGTAQAGTDFTLAQGTLTIPAGTTTGNITVPILNDGVYTGNINFTVVLSTPQHCALTNTTSNVTITDILPPPVNISSFTASPNYGSAGGPYTVAQNVPVTFSAAASVAILPATWKWDFGDATFALSPNTVTHTYPTPGTYTVTLTVTDAQGHSVSQSITEIVGLDADHDGFPDNDEKPLTVSKLLGTAKLGQGRDSFSLTGSIPNVAGIKNPTGYIFEVRVGDVPQAPALPSLTNGGNTLSGMAVVDCTLNSKGKSRAPDALTVTPKSTHKPPKGTWFSGGTLNFSAKITGGAFAAIWGADATQTVAKMNISVTVKMQLTPPTLAAGYVGQVYAQYGVSCVYTSKGGKSATFKH